MTKSSRAIIIAAALSLLSSFPAYSASIEEFQTKEYYGSGGLDLINAAEAYSKGYTGKGITIGIDDYPVNLEHESFSDKKDSKYIGSTDLDGISWMVNSHGSHVGGIAAGAKNGKGMHGVAFDADIISTAWVGKNFDFPEYDSFPQIKSINNSWGGEISFDTFYLPYEIEDDLSPNKALEKLYKDLEQKGYFDQLSPIKEAASKDRLLVFSNCNYGKTDTSLIPFVHWLNNKDVNNLISVTATLNSYGNNTHLERNSDGSITGDFINAPLSTLAKYYEDSIISAPGWNIYSSDATDKKGYLIDTGTSMSAPFVTGGAALIQQAFPYMNSKQIGDVLLSTANSNINTRYPFCVTDSHKLAYDNDGNSYYKCSAKIYYLDERTQSDDEQIKKDLLTFANSIKDDGNSGENHLNYIKKAIEQGRSRHS